MGSSRHPWLSRGCLTGARPRRSPDLSEGSRHTSCREFESSETLSPEVTMGRPFLGMLGREDSNLRMAAPKAAALPLGYALVAKRA